MRCFWSPTWKWDELTFGSRSNLTSWPWFCSFRETTDYSERNLNTWVKISLRNDPIISHRIDPNYQNSLLSHTSRANTHILDVNIPLSSANVGHTIFSLRFRACVMKYNQFRPRTNVWGASITSIRDCAATKTDQGIQTCQLMRHGPYSNVQ